MPASVFLRETLYPQHLPTFRDDLGDKCGLTAKKELGLDKKSSSVRQLIIRVSDKLKAGEISLIETTPEEAEQAKDRLDSHRKKRRERHARKKQS